MDTIIAIALAAAVLGLILGRVFKKSVIRNIQKHFSDKNQP